MASITEMSNPLTQNIDIADAADILRMLHQTDDQIFGGHGTPGIQDERFILSMEKACDFLSDSITSSIRKKECLRVILSGAGTSGRLAMLLSETFNDLCGSCFDPPLFDFLIAGGTRALIKSQESAEDDPQQGVEELEKFYSTCDRFIYIGITCGLSAQYVSGQLYHTVQNRQQPAILVGFNPLERARAIVPENWDKSFLDVLQAVQKAQDVFFLNPIIGPEPITGSTRMKGGTTTKIILETLFYAALKRVSKNIELKFSADPFLDDDSDTSATIHRLRIGEEQDLFPGGSVVCCSGPGR